MNLHHYIKEVTRPTTYKNKINWKTEPQESEETGFAEGKVVYDMASLTTKPSSVSSRLEFKITLI